MRAHKLTHANATMIRSFDWIPGFYCKGCETYKSLACEHNFEDDKGRVFEIMFCESCGNIVEETDVTEHYADRAESEMDDENILENQSD